MISRNFAYIFSSRGQWAEDIRLVTDCVSPVISDDMNLQLLREFTEEDMKMAFFEIEPSKAPGRDGFSGLFFQKFWKVVGDDVTKTCLEILNDGVVLGTRMTP